MKRNRNEKEICCKKECFCQSRDIIKCLTAFEKEFACLKELAPDKHLNRAIKEKALFCILLRDLATLEKKLDKILSELTSDWESDWGNHCDGNIAVKL